MAQITASMVKELREKTGAGMMDCKKALAENDGDIEKAVEFLRKKGLSAAAKKAGRIAAEGVVAEYSADNVGAIIEVNTETDFVAKNDDFKAFVAELAKIVAEQNPADVDALMKCKTADGSTVEEELTEKIATIGEKISIRRFVRLDGENISTYIHMGGKIGVITSLKGGDADLSKDICLHVAASNPKYLNKDQVDQEFIDKEKDIFVAKLKEQGKPENIIPKIVEGQVNKLLQEVCLVNQPFVKDPDVTIEKLLSNKGAEIVSYSRFEMGEGLEKKQENFAEEVMKQIKS
ncbi:translation elongation factor Ts [Limisalsivibrio acetivorans]|uniref:translation elongation factor Ts n=1 Tax=Limisalsivibrio acetivorans TaxID=1304888 RepID=UPI0003B5AB32|nr:translation elongation factor Ts [Limisalsivibrio acetivorans]